ncbi:restriction endonuclease [Dasania marina]|uniref:restriction endonuclease n=1 Tax=Dasania marina TaxID=471499 RepID=UPI0030DA2FCC|tara:strand:+ start:3407 stop:3745 length:339 start_codon:yes stop_codon:yes gene_type:complete
MTGIDYEHFCADILRKNGWKVDVSQASNDQGVDIMAYKDDLAVAIQCKKYSKPVGNSAVQEIVAGKQFRGAHVAAVVTNNSYTPSAKKLANTTDVFLLHHNDLAQADVIFQV